MTEYQNTISDLAEAIADVLKQRTKTTTVAIWDSCVTLAEEVLIGFVQENQDLAKLEGGDLIWISPRCGSCRKYYKPNRFSRGEYCPSCQTS